MICFGLCHLGLFQFSCKFSIILVFTSHALSRMVSSGRRYIMMIMMKASDETGLSVRQGRLYYREKPVATLEASDVLKQFLDWCTAIGETVLVPIFIVFGCSQLYEY